MKKDKEEMLPKIVEDRLQEAYEQIRKGEIRQMKERKRAAKNWISAAAVLILIITIPSFVYAAVVYFQKTERRNADDLTYEFSLNYELVPGVWQVMPSYIPEGLHDAGDGKYLTDDDGWITIMPIYTTAELDKINNQISVENTEKVEHTTLSGMSADVITFRESGKYQSPTYIFLFNEKEGYVIQIIADYQIDRKELLQFADSLTVTRVGDADYENADEKALREKEEKDAAQAALESSKNWNALITLGIPDNKIFPIGRELLTDGGACGYTVTDYEFLESIDGFNTQNFFDYTRFDGWLNADKSLRPYTRIHYDKNGTLLAQQRAEQEFLRVNISVCRYHGSGDVPLSFSLQYVTEGQGGVLTWSEDIYTSVPEENYSLQMDDSAVWFDQAVNTNGDARSSFFFREMNPGKELEYTLLFVIDKDREQDFLLYPTGYNNSLWQTETQTAGEIRDSLDVYIRLQ